MNADDVRARLLADFQVAHMVRQAERPDGLTASSIGGCSQYAARELLGVPQGTEGDFWRGLRGTYVHDGMADDLARVDPEFVDCRTRPRYTWQPGWGLPPITGAGDFAVGGVWVEAKTRSRDECRWHADHGPDPQHAMQASIGAEAEGHTEAAVAYFPVEGGWEEVSVHMVNVAHWTNEARLWLERANPLPEYQEMIDRGASRERALAQVLDPIPREPQVNWCRMFCGHFKDCRGDYVAPADLEIPDPLVREAVAEAARWRDVRLDAEKREKAAKAMITHAEGRVSTTEEAIDVRQQHVAGSDERRGHTKTVVTRRPA